MSRIYNTQDTGLGNMTNYIFGLLNFKKQNKESLVKE